MDLNRQASSATSFSGIMICSSRFNVSVWIWSAGWRVIWKGVDVAPGWKFGVNRAREGRYCPNFNTAKPAPVKTRIKQPHNTNSTIIKTGKNEVDFFIIRSCEGSDG